MKKNHLGISPGSLLKSVPYFVKRITNGADEKRKPMSVIMLGLEKGNTQI